MERRLAAILAADVVGYSRLMGEDEADTLSAFKRHLTKLIEPKARQYNGRIVKLMGDGALMEFASAVDAVAFAVEVQCAMRERNRDVPEKRQIVYRVGINIGDIIIDGDDIFGDGVNIAARLEGLAEPGGICIARNVFNQVKGKLDLTFSLLGKRKVKNIAQPVTVHQVVLDDRAEQMVTEVQADTSERGRWHSYTAAGMAVALIAAGLIWWQPWTSKYEPASIERMAYPLPDKPSIAVLPFTNMSDDASQEYFADGMTEDLITDLSKISGLFVIARSTSFTYKGRAVNLPVVAKELGVRYVLEGSVRASDGRVRINAQLIDALTGGHLWAERYDRELGGIFSLQDDVTAKIVSALAVKITKGEKELLGRTNQYTTPETYDVFMRGREALRRSTPEGIEDSRDYFRKAIAMDPGYARAYAALSSSYILGVAFYRSDDSEEMIRQSLKYALKAIELDHTLPQGYFSIAMAYLRQGRHMDAIASARQAVKYDPNYAEGYGMLASVLAYAGEGVEAKRVIQKGMDLNPRYSGAYVEVLSRAHFVMGEYDAAIKLLQNCLSRDSGYLLCRMLLASTYGLTGKIEEAEWEVEEVRILTPDFSTQWKDMASYFLKAEDKQRFLSGLRKAGLSAELE